MDIAASFLFPVFQPVGSYCLPQLLVLDVVVIGKDEDDDEKYPRQKWTKNRTKMMRLRRLVEKKNRKGC